MLREITKQEEFDNLITKSEVPVLVDFFTSWCGPCLRLAPVLSQLSDQMDGKAEVVKVDITEDTVIAQKYNIASVPTLIVFKEGQEVKRMVGSQKLEVLKECLSALC